MLPHPTAFSYSRRPTTPNEYSLKKPWRIRRFRWGRIEPSNQISEVTRCHNLGSMEAKSLTPVFQENAVVLFQGDSITDALRDRSDGASLGFGYAAMAAAWFSALYPEKRVTFLNRGISGNRVKDLIARWEEDCIALKPDWVSILIGINDCWRRFDRNDPTSLEEYKSGYRRLLTEVKEKTGAGLILCEPFVLPVPKDREEWRVDLDPKIQAVQRIGPRVRRVLRAVRRALRPGVRPHLPRVLGAGRRSPDPRRSRLDGPSVASDRGCAGLISGRTALRPLIL